jgi:hypothetical protein
MHGGLDTMANFELQPAESELQQLAETCWEKSDGRERQLEKDAFEAGEAIRGGDFSLANLEAIVRWKSERVVHYLIGNSNESIRIALKVAVSPKATAQEAIKALIELQGVDIPVASAIMAAIYPERYTVLDFHALEALGVARHNAEFYAAYNAFCNQLAERGIIKPQENLPGPTALRALDRALWAWSNGKGD